MKPSRFAISKKRAALVVAALTLISASGVSAQASEAHTQYWQSPQDSQRSYDYTGSLISSTTQVISGYADRSQRPLEQQTISSSFIEANTQFADFEVASNYSDREYSSALSAHFGGLSLYSSMGRGYSYASTISDYRGLDPYAFHGGNLVDFRYAGQAIGIQLRGEHQIQFGQTVVRADRLEDRKASFIDYSSNRFFTRFTQVERGAERVGFGFDAGMNFGKVNVGYQQLQSRYDVSTQRIRFNWNRDSKNQFWLDFTNHENSRLVDNTDFSMMLSWRHSFGSKVVPSYFDDVDASEGETNEKKKKKRSNRGLLIGGGAAAAALLLSSGSSGQDEANREVPFAVDIQAQHDAARAVLNNINPVSVRQNVEFGGYIFQAADGSYASTAPIRGEVASVTLPLPQFAIPSGTRARASYHTHAGPDPRFDNENFSPTDLASDVEFNLDGYLGTPAGRFRYHEVATGRISTLGRIANGTGG